jgi:hypothetical protein
MSKHWQQWLTAVRVRTKTDRGILRCGGGGVLLSILVFLNWWAEVEKDTKTGSVGTSVARAVQHVNEEWDEDGTHVLKKRKLINSA